MQSTQDPAANRTAYDNGGARLSRVKFFDAISMELERAYDKHGQLPWSRHEFFAILKEEVDEVWDSVRKDEPRQMLVTEIIQVAAMCARYLETSDPSLGPKGSPSSLARENAGRMVAVVGNQMGQELEYTPSGNFPVYAASCPVCTKSSRHSKYDFAGCEHFLTYDRGSGIFIFSDPNQSTAHSS